MSVRLIAAERNPMNVCFKRRDRKGSRRGAQRNDLCILCENLRALCVESDPSPNNREDFVGNAESFDRVE